MIKQKLKNDIHFSNIRNLFLKIKNNPFKIPKLFLLHKSTLIFNQITLIIILLKMVSTYALCSYLNINNFNDFLRNPNDTTHIW